MGSWSEASRNVRRWLITLPKQRPHEQRRRSSSEGHSTWANQSERRIRKTKTEPTLEQQRQQPQHIQGKRHQLHEPVEVQHIDEGLEVTDMGDDEGSTTLLPEGGESVIARPAQGSQQLL